MPLADFSELARLSKRQRLKLEEELWFSAFDDHDPTHRTHKKIIDERWSAYKEGRIKRITVAQLEERLQHR